MTKSIKHRVIKALRNEEQKYYVGPPECWETDFCSEYKKATYWAYNTAAYLLSQMPEEVSQEDILSLFETIDDEEFLPVKTTVESAIAEAHQ